MSSVKLAVPLLLVISCVMAAGTLVESSYNTEIAKLWVYDAWWFDALMVLLWVNIFLATVSRIPFNKNHTGFVVTHIGLLTLLIGGLITSRFGIDGQMLVQEGSSSKTVLLPNLAISLLDLNSSKKETLVFKRISNELDKKNLQFINTEFSMFQVLKYIPFSKTEETLVPSKSESMGRGIVLSLTNRFATQSVWLHEKQQSRVSLGPLELTLKDNESSVSSKNHSRILVFDKKTETQVAEYKIDDLKKRPQKIRDVTIRLKKTYSNATVAGGALKESGSDVSNPAVELELSDGKEKQREILFAQFPTFSLNANSKFNLMLRYEHVASSKVNASGPLAELSVQQDGSVLVELKNQSKKINEIKMLRGETIELPWMKMKLQLQDVFVSSEPTMVSRAIELEKKSELPPASLYVSTQDSKDLFWLPENSERSIFLENKEYHISFGKDSLTLPFEITLEKFHKLSYPGTETPLSFESNVRLTNGLASTISMNEPLKHMGYTFYQASYIEPEGEPPISVFSVNKDPGREIKYIGSLITSVGIIIFVLMRSRWFQKRRSL